VTKPGPSSRHRSAARVRNDIGDIVTRNPPVTGQPTDRRPLAPALAGSRETRAFRGESENRTVVPVPGWACVSRAADTPS
jgi:hypothetical protein